MYNIVMLQL